MAPESKKESSNHVTSWRETSLNASTLILSVVQEAATFAPFPQLKQAAAIVSIILETVQTVKDNKNAYKRLGEDSGRLVVVIWRSYQKAESPNQWLSPEMREILEDLTHTLDDICSFVKEQLSRSKTIRVIFSKADAAKISEYRQYLNSALQKFDLQAHMNIDIKLGKLSEQIQYRNDEDAKRILEITAREARAQEEAEKIHAEERKIAEEISALDQLKKLEIDHHAEDERWYSDQLKKIEKETRAQQLELERLRETASEVEANRLKKAQEKEIAQLRRKTEAEEDNSLRRVKGQAHSSKKKNSRKAEVREEDEDLKSRQSSKTTTRRRKTSNTSLRDEETEDESRENEQEYTRPPTRKSPKAKRRPRNPPDSPPDDMDDLTARFQGFGKGSPHENKSNSYPPPQMYFPTYSPPMGPHGYGYGHGYGVGMPGTVVNSGVGNVTNTNVSNVGNDNSVRKVYRAPHPRNQRGC